MERHRDEFRWESRRGDEDIVMETRVIGQRLEDRGVAVQQCPRRLGGWVLRAQRAFRLGKVAITPGLLGIYRINEDSIVDETYTRVSVEGSSGLTLNLTANVDVPLGDRTALGLVYGSPLVVRDVRPDGLTRSMVVGATVRWRF